MCKTLFAALLLPLGLTGATYGQQRITTRVVPFTGKLVSVVDGDTALISFKGKTEPYDLEGIDAPEIGQPFGDKAKDALEAMLAKTRRPRLSFVIETKVTALPALMTSNTTTRNKGILIRAGAKSANVELLTRGLAWSLNDKYSRFQDQAKRAERGLWSDDDPINPADWRKAQQRAEMAERAKANWETRVKNFRPNGINEIVRDVDGKTELWIYRPRPNTGGTVRARDLSDVIQSRINNAAWYEERKKVAEATGKYDAVLIVDF